MILRTTSELYRAVTRTSIKPFWTLILLSSLTSMLEAMGVLSVMPFIAAVSNSAFLDRIQDLPLLGGYASRLERGELIAILGVGVILLAWAVSGFSAYTNVRLLKFSYSYENTLSRLLFEKYLALEYQVYSKRAPSELTKNILHETHRLVHGVLVPWIHLIAKSISGVVLVALLFVVNWFATVICGGLIGIGYVLAYRLVQGRLKRYGDQSTESNTRRHQIVTEALNGLKELKHYSLGWRFSNLYAKHSSEYINALTHSDTVALLPKYVFDALIMTVAIGATLVVGLEGNITEHLPTISVFALASYRLMPIFHQLFNGLAVIRFHESCIPVVLGEVHAKTREEAKSPEVTGSEWPSPPVSLTLAGIDYQYPSSAVLALHGVSLDIPSKGVVCIVGQSGSGKSTLLDLLAGTIEPSSGSILVNGKPIRGDTRSAWRSVVGLASQHAPLFLGSLFENVTLWASGSSPDEAYYRQCISMVCLEQFSTETSGEQELCIGQQGRSVSGGQRQRIAIARALYRRSKVMLLDEPTSALDRRTAASIVDSLVTIARTMPVVIVSHDPAIAEIADKVVLVEDGKVVDEGNYRTLLSDSKKYRELIALVGK